MSKIPGFLGIGAPRCGTTWLYENLSRHPEIWMTPVKEIHYFDQLGKPAVMRKKYWRDLQRRAYHYIKPNNDNNRRANLSWDASFFLKKRNLGWYLSLFRPNENQLSGEITPSYASLQQHTVEQIHGLNPDMKIIYIMRDPVERLWSNAIYYLVRQKKLDPRKISNQELLKIINTARHISNTGYMQNLDVWESVFPTDQIYIDFYDNIRENPEEMILRIYNFLELDSSSKHIPLNVRMKINSTDKHKLKIPSVIEREIAENYIDQLQKLNQRFGGHTTKWLERSKKILEENKYD